MAPAGNELPCAELCVMLFDVIMFFNYLVLHRLNAFGIKGQETRLL